MRNQTWTYTSLNTGKVGNGSQLKSHQAKSTKKASRKVKSINWNRKNAWNLIADGIQEEVVWRTRKT